MQRFELIGRVGVLVCALGAVTLANAAAIEEIIVTAQKREQNVQDVGISISAFSGEQLIELGYSNAQQVTALAAGVVTAQPNGEANYSMSIRGAVSSDFSSNNESPVAVYLDEAYISQMSGAGFMLFDMDRVEILRGAQGTLFGRNATGGLVHYVTRKPEQELSGYAKATVGEYSQFRFEGAVGGGIGDTVSARLSVATHHNDGYVTNRLTPGKKLNNAKDWAVRGQLLFTPSEELDVLLNVRGSGQDIRTGFFDFKTANIFGQYTPGEPSITLEYEDTDNDPYAGDYDSEGYNDAETLGASATVKWTRPNFTLTSITDFQSVEREYLEDTDASPVPWGTLALSTDADQFSQELRLEGDTDRLKWVAGLYYLDIDIADANGGEFNLFADIFALVLDLFPLYTPEEQALAFVPGLERGVDNPYTIDTQSFSAFGQIEYEFSEQWTGILGLRWIDEDKDFIYANNLVRFIPGATKFNGNPNIIATLDTRDLSSADSLIAARAQVDFRPNDDVLLYFSYNHGVRAGGYNVPFFPLADSSDKNFNYDPEEVDVFEAGFKWTLADGTARLNGAVYRNNYKDYQAFDVVVIDAITSNRDADMWGFELELNATPADGLDLLLGVGYNDAEVVLDGGRKSRPVMSPEWNLNGLARYEWPAFDGSIAIHGDFSYLSSQLYGLSGSGVLAEGSYVVANTSIRYAPEGKRWEVAVFANNVFDEEYRVQKFDLSGNLWVGDGIAGMVQEYYGRPRWVGASFMYSF